MTPPAKRAKVRRAAPAQQTAARRVRLRSTAPTDASLPPRAQASQDAGVLAEVTDCPQSSPDVEVVAELTADEAEARKRAKAALDGDLIDLTALSSDEGEDATVARVDALRASPAAADAAAAATLGPCLLAAAAAGGADILSSLLQQGADVGLADRDGSTALHCASRDADVEATEAVLESGTSASRKDTGGDTPVHGAAVDLRHRSGVHAALFALMDSLQTGDDPAALRGLVEGDNSPLCDAVNHNEMLAMKYLVMRGCAGMDHAAVEKALRPALLKARKCHDSGFLAYLRGSPVHVRTPSGGLFCVLAYNDSLIAELEASLSDVLDIPGCKRGSLTLSYKGKLLDKAEHFSSYQLLPLALAPDLKAPPLLDGCVHVVSDAVAAFFRAVADSSVADVARCVEDSGIDLNMHDCFGIIEAYAHGRSGCPDANWMNTRGALPTALWDAVHMVRAPLVTKLLSLGADFKTRLLVDAFPSGSFTGPGAADLDCGGETLLHAAARLRSPAVTAALIKAGADVNARCGAVCPGIIVADATPLYWAVRCGNVATVRLLLAFDANPRARCSELGSGRSLAVRNTGTLLHLAASRVPSGGGGPSCDDMEASRGAIISLLAMAGAGLNAVDQNGKTALHLAAHYNCLAAIDALLAAGANVHALDKSGKTPHAEAVSYNHAAAAARLSVGH
jgi:ankyrin repeat protein